MSREDLAWRWGHAEGVKDERERQARYAWSTLFLVVFAAAFLGVAFALAIHAL